MRRPSANWRWSHRLAGTRFGGVHHLLDARSTGAAETPDTLHSDVERPPTRRHGIESVVVDRTRRSSWVLARVSDSPSLTHDILETL